MEDWALIRRLASEGVPKAQITVRLGISRTTVVKAVASDAPPKHERKPVVTSFSPLEPWVAALLAEFPEMPATVLAERVGWDGSPSSFPGERGPSAAAVPPAGSGGQADLVAG